MAIRNLRRQATNPLAAPGTPTSAPIYVDSDDNIVKIIPAGSGSTEVQLVDASSTQTLTNKTLTAPTITNAVQTASPVDAAAATLTVTAAAHAGRTVALNRAAGVTATLPAATGTGNIYRFAVQVTASGGNYVIAVANTTDYMIGVALFDGDDAANAANGFTTANTGTVATESDTITLNGTTTGGIKGAIVEVIDLASAIFAVRVTSAASGTEATPFSAAV